MQTVTTIGLDIAKSVFQVHGVDAEGNVMLRRQLKRRYVLAFFQRLAVPVGIEACASSHHWARALQALGHTVRLMPPAYVKPYVKRHKNDAADAEQSARRSPAEHAVRRDQDAEQQGCLTSSHPTFSCASRPPPSIRSAPILPSSGSSRRSDGAWGRTAARHGQL